VLKEFGDFVRKGNVLDLAVAVIIGGAFGAIVTSLVNDILMPIISIFTGGLDFASLFVALDGNRYATLAAAQEAGAATLNYGLFIQAIINFLIIAFVIFLLIRQAKKLEKEAEAAPPPGPSAEEKLLAEIRDLLAKR
jgi:large conductance mechanosensitive channel